MKMERISEEVIYRAYRAFDDEESDGGEYDDGIAHDVLDQSLLEKSTDNHSATLVNVVVYHRSYDRSMKSTATHKFSECLQRTPVDSEIWTIVDAVFTMKPTTDRTLRDLLLQ